eukprot:m.80333 g.80333  ORF g.80333 m.80333 type:complete len:59 (+) comp14203_c0_seq3:847-1023(+)
MSTVVLSWPIQLKMADDHLTQRRAAGEKDETCEINGLTSMSAAVRPHRLCRLCRCPVV